MLNPNNNFKKLTANIKDLDFDGVLYSFFPKAMYLDDKTQPLMHFSDNFAPFVNHYLANNYGNKDFVIRLIHQRGIQPIDWWQEINAGNVTRAESEVTISARDNFSIQNGLTIPVLNSTFAMAAVSVVSTNNDLNIFQEVKNKHINGLQELSKNYHIYIMSSNKKLRFFVEPLFTNLNQSKKNVIKHLISGAPMKSIGNTYDISQRYAEKTLINIRIQFGSISTNELLYLFGVCGINEYL